MVVSISAFGNHFQRIALSKKFIPSPTYHPPHEQTLTSTDNAIIPARNIAANTKASGIAARYRPSRPYRGHRRDPHRCDFELKTTPPHQRSLHRHNQHPCTHPYNRRPRKLSEPPAPMRYGMRAPPKHRHGQHQHNRRHVRHQRRHRCTPPRHTHRYSQRQQRRHCTHFPALPCPE